MHQRNRKRVSGGSLPSSSETSNKQQQQIDVKQAIESDSKAIAWLEQIKKLETGLQEAQTAQQDLLLRLEQSEPEKIQLHNANKAMQLEAEYALLNNNQARLLTTEQKIQELMLAKKITLATAESCTGGKIAST